MDTKKLSTLKRLIDAGYTDEKTVLDLTAKDMVCLCKSLQEMSTILELQDAIKSHKLYSYLAEEGEG